MEHTDASYELAYEELKDYLKSTEEDKENILALLKRAHEWVVGRCGDFGLTHTRGKDLVFNRVRFDFNGVVHEFEKHYLNDLSNLSFELWDGDDHEET